MSEMGEMGDQEILLQAADGQGMPRVMDIEPDGVMVDVPLPPVEKHPVFEASSGLVTLENIDNQDKHIYEPGSGIQHTMFGNETRPVEVPLAKMFLDQHPKYVRVYRKTTVRLKPGEPTMWVANMTGNPHLPETIQTSRIVNGKEVFEDNTPNPFRREQTFSFKMQSDQVIYKGRDDNDLRCINTAPFYIDLKPFERVQLPTGMATTILNRTGMLSVMHERGRVAACRAPTDFEPDPERGSTWSLDDVRLYAHMVDPKTFSRETLATVYKSEASHDGSKAINSTKLSLLRALFFRLIDDRYGLPTKAAFEHKKLEAAEKAAALVSLNRLAAESRSSPASPA